MNPLLAPSDALSCVRACRLAGFSRAAWYRKSKAPDQSTIRLRIRQLAQARSRFGYFSIYVLLRREGWSVDLKRVRRLYRLEGMQVRLRVRKRRRRSLHRGPAAPPTGAQQRWSMDFVHDQLADGRVFRVLTVVDQWSRKSPYDLGCTLVRDRAEILQRIRHVALRLGMVDAPAKLMRASALQQLTCSLVHLAPTQRSERVLMRDLRWAIERVRLLNRQLTFVRLREDHAALDARAEVPLAA